MPPEVDPVDGVDGAEGAAGAGEEEPESDVLLEPLPAGTVEDEPERLSVR